VYNLDKRSVRSLDFVVNRLFVMLFQTSNMEIVKYCQECFWLCTVDKTLR